MLQGLGFQGCFAPSCSMPVSDCCQITQAQVMLHCDWLKTGQSFSRGVLICTGCRCSHSSSSYMAGSSSGSYLFVCSSGLGTITQPDTEELALLLASFCSKFQATLLSDARCRLRAEVLEAQQRPSAQQDGECGAAGQAGAAEQPQSPVPEAAPGAGSHGRRPSALEQRDQAQGGWHHLLGSTQQCFAMLEGDVVSTLAPSGSVLFFVWSFAADAQGLQEPLSAAAVAFACPLCSASTSWQLALLEADQIPGRSWLHSL